VHEAGDHFVVIARVTELGATAAGEPLLFYRSRFSVCTEPDGDAPPEVVDTLLSWPRYADWI
jgi:3-hydroxy-9,10-secoandrosta-1,3,5(10)-triene-9,17-dione monooxygenase reductase component